MISSLLAFALHAAAAPAAPSSPQRKAFAACLRALTIDSLEKKMDAQTFGKSLDTACTAEAAALGDAIVAQRVAAGLKRADARQIADGDVLDFQLNATEMYAEYLESNTKPF